MLTQIPRNSPIVWGLMWQAIGGAIAWPLYFFFHLLWTESQPSQIQPVLLPEARAIPLSFLAGAIFPAVLGMLPTWMTRSPRAHQFILAAWQLDPVWVSVFHAGLTMLFSLLPRSEGDTRAAVWWTRLSFLVAAATCAIGHLYVLGRILISENERLSFTRMYVPRLLTGPADSTSQLARGPWLFLQYDFIIYSLASLSWVFILLSRMKPRVSWIDRLNLSLLMFLGAVSLGPGTVVSLALWWREGEMSQSRDQRGSRRSKQSGYKLKK